MISSHELREKYQKFFESKGHARIASAPLVPENDPSVLFTTAGMHPLVPYLKGQPHPQGPRLTDAQKCLRTTDIDEVGDATHATVFEMLGNWSLGDYFKKEAIEWSWEFLTDKKWLGISPDYLAVSVFAGGEDAPRDDESAKLWQKVGAPKERVAFLDEQENWWPAYAKASPSAKATGDRSARQSPAGPQGPDTEMFYWTGNDNPPKKFDPLDDKWVEIWNDVFMEYNRTEAGKLERLAQQNVDTGMGLERTVMALNGLASIYEIDTYKPLMDFIADGGYIQNPDPTEKRHRLVADHIKAATFVMTDENSVVPSKTEQGYVLRRLIRRAVMIAKTLGVQNYNGLMLNGMDLVVKQYSQVYPLMKKKISGAKEAMCAEVRKFEATLSQGLKRLSVLVAGAGITGQEAFQIYESYGIPVEMTKEFAREKGIVLADKFNREFEEASKKHQQMSREGAQKKFKGGLADWSDKSVKYHTATHLLHKALRETLGDHVLQRGSNITAERLRFDFSHPKKMTSEEIRQVARLVNEKIKADLPVKREEMTVEEAKKKGALGLFKHKYGERVSVYTIGNYSTEICGGPHVERTGELGVFKIIKEESSSAGIRRIKAQLMA